MTIVRRNGSWFISGPPGRVEVFNADDRNLFYFHFPVPHVRVDYVLQLSHDGQRLEGNCVVIQTHDLAVIQGWTPVSFSRRR